MTEHGVFLGDWSHQILCQTDYETFVTCIDANISDDCHDCVCDALADQGTPCP